MDPHVSLGVVAHILGHPGQPRALEPVELWSTRPLAGHRRSHKMAGNENRSKWSQLFYELIALFAALAPILARLSMGSCSHNSFARVEKIIELRKCWCYRTSSGRGEALGGGTRSGKCIANKLSSIFVAYIFGLPPCRRTTGGSLTSAGSSWHSWILTHMFGSGDVSSAVNGIQVFRLFNGYCGGR